MNDTLELQRRLDDLALKLDGDDQLLVWRARSQLNAYEERLARIRAEAE